MVGTTREHPKSKRAGGEMRHLASLERARRILQSPSSSASAKLDPTPTEVRGRIFDAFDDQLEAFVANRVEERFPLKSGEAFKREGSYDRIRRRTHRASTSLTSASSFTANIASMDTFFIHDAIERARKGTDLVVPLAPFMRQDSSGDSSRASPLSFGSSLYQKSASADEEENNGQGVTDTSLGESQSADSPTMPRIRRGRDQYAAIDVATNDRPPSKVVKATLAERIRRSAQHGVHDDGEADGVAIESLSELLQRATRNVSPNRDVILPPRSPRVLKFDRTNDRVKWMQMRDHIAAKAAAAEDEQRALPHSIKHDRGKHNPRLRLMPEEASTGAKRTDDKDDVFDVPYQSLIEAAGASPSTFSDIDENGCASPALSESGTEGRTPTPETLVEDDFGHTGMPAFVERMSRFKRMHTHVRVPEDTSAAIGDLGATLRLAESRELREFLRHNTDEAIAFKRRFSPNFKSKAAMRIVASRTRRERPAISTSPKRRLPLDSVVPQPPLSDPPPIDDEIRIVNVPSEDDASPLPKILEPLDPSKMYRRVRLANLKNHASLNGREGVAYACADGESFAVALVDGGEEKTLLVARPENVIDLCSVDRAISK